MNTEPRHKMTVKVLDALRTIQGYTLEEYQEAREELIADLSKDAEAVALAKAAGHASPLTVAPSATLDPFEPPATAAWEAPTPAAVPSFVNATVPSCAHGPRTGKSGNSAKGPWRAWMCPAPKGDPSQCQPDWVTRGTPAWNSFHA
jgi:hypothetical protein